MKIRFLQHRGGPGLRLFFHGWSMDCHTVEMLDPAGEDLLVVWDYTGLDPAELAQELAVYSSIRLAAWSLGVWAAARVLGELGLRPAEAVAINGTLRPIHEEYGIAPELFRGTIENWPEERARERFLLRMCGSRSGLDALTRPERTPASQQSELAALERAITTSAEPVDFYTRAVIGSGDRIFPAAAQRKFWAQTDTPIAELDLPHCPFAGLTAFEEVFDLGRHR